MRGVLPSPEHGASDLLSELMHARPVGQPASAAAGVTVCLLVG